MRLFTTLWVMPNLAPTSRSESPSKKIACISSCSLSDSKGRAAFSLSTIDGNQAKVDVCGIQRDVDLTLVGSCDENGQPRVGQWVLVHVGFAMSVINEAEARDTLDALQNMFDVEPDVGALLYGEEK